MARSALLVGFCLLLVALLPGAAAQVGTPSTVALVLLQDAHTDSQQADTNFGTSTTLDMKHGRSGPSPDCGVSSCLHTLLEFDVSPIPAGATILDANLTVQTVDTGTGTFTSQVRVVLGSWSESTLTWNNSPSFGPVLDEFESDVEVGGIRSFNITNAVQGLIGTATFGLAFLNDSAPNKFQEWGADENPARTAASLSVTWVLLPPSAIGVLIAISAIVVAMGLVALVAKKDRSLEDLGLFILLVFVFVVVAGIAVALFAGG